MNSPGGAGEDPARDDTAVEVDVTKHRGVDVVAVVGDFDAYSARDVKRVVFDATVCAQTEVVLDLTGVGFMDSMGVSTIFACRKALESRVAHLSLVVPPDTRVFQLVRSLGLDVLVAIYPSTGAALAALSTSIDL